MVFRDIDGVPMLTEITVHEPPKMFSSVWIDYGRLLRWWRARHIAPGPTIRRRAS